MIEQSVKEFKRIARSWENSSSRWQDTHTERVKRQTWWLFGILPLYSKESIVASNL